MKNNFAVDALIVVFVFLIGMSLLANEKEEVSSQISSEIGAFDDLINNGNVVEDGYLEDIYKEDYEGNLIAKLSLEVGNFIVNTLNKGIDFALEGIKSILD